MIKTYYILYVRKLNQFFRKVALYLYGSRARGDAHEGSDWDLLILLNRPQDENQDFRRISYPIMQVGFDLDQYFSVHTQKRSGTP